MGSAIVASGMRGAVPAEVRPRHRDGDAGRGVLCARRDFPDKDIADLKAMCVEKYHGAGVKTPQELITHLPHADPVDREYIRPTGYDGVFAIDPVWDEQLPSFS